MSKVFQEIITATPAVTAVTYSANALIGTGVLSVTLSEHWASAQSGSIFGVKVIDLNANSANMTLIVFSSDPSNTTFTNNSALDIADADLFKICAIIPITNHMAFADNSISYAANVKYLVQAEPGTNKLYFCLRAEASRTQTTTTDLQIRIEAESDKYNT